MQPLLITRPAPWSKSLFSFHCCPLWYSSAWNHTKSSRVTRSKAKFLPMTNIMWLFPTLYFQLFFPSLTPLQLWQWPPCSALPVPRTLMSSLHLLFPLPEMPFPHSSFPHSFRSAPKHLSQWGSPSHPPPPNLPYFVFVLNTLSPPNMPHTSLTFIIVAHPSLECKHLHLC